MMYLVNQLIKRVLIDTRLQIIKMPKLKINKQCQECCKKNLEDNYVLDDQT